MPNHRTRTGCLTCRRSRVKCDEKLPRCSRCLRSGKDCDRGLPVKFVHGTRLAREPVDKDWSGIAGYVFEATQPWVPTRLQDFTFLDETRSTAEEYVDQGQQNVLLCGPEATIEEYLASQPDVDEPTQAPTPGHSVDRSHLLETIRIPPPLNGRLTPENAKKARLQDGREAILFEHYLTNIGPSLDVCDPHRVFSTVIPELAMTSSLAFNAILAASAHHLSHTTESEANDAETYHARCVELLIPLLSARDTVQDEVIATVVLLRFYEQMASAVTGSDSGRHLTGASAFMGSGNYLSADHQIHRAAFWLFLRQDIDVAISQQRCLTLNLEDVSGAIVSESAREDWAHANRIVWIGAQCTNHLFGRDRIHDVFLNLEDQLLLWERSRPESFRPLYRRSGNVFDEIWFTQPWHALAMQYYHTAKILLLLSDRQYQCVGIGSRQAKQNLQAQVMRHAMQLFSISSSGRDIQSRLGGCLVVSVVAPFVTDEASRIEIFSMLRQLEHQHAWPTKRIALDATSEWGWSDEVVARHLQTWQSNTVHTKLGCTAAVLSDSTPRL